MIRACRTAPAAAASAWLPDGSGFYYTRCAPGEKPDGGSVAGCRCGRTSSARARERSCELGKDLQIARIQLASDRRGRVLASVQNGDGGTFRHYLRDKTGWRQLDDWGDAIVSIDFASGASDDLWIQVARRKRAARQGR